MVTAEMAMALPGLVLVLGFALTLQSVVATRAACLDAARAAARAAARGDSDDAVAAVARRVLPFATSVSVERAGGLVSVRVSARPRVVGGRLTVPEASVESTAEDEGAP